MTGYAFLLAIVIALGSAGTAASQVLQAQRNTVVEVSFESDVAYANPITNVEVTVDFESPEGEHIVQDAFWAGENAYLVRFAPPSTGRWTYCSQSTDTMNSGLNGHCGQIQVEDYSGPDPFKLHGWPQVSPNRHYLTYEDGSPFFLLSDAVLEITWKSTTEEVDAYVADRRSKGFNAAWMVPMSHQYFYNFGVQNEYGQDYFLQEDFELLNPDYFAYLDRIVDRMNNAGMIVLLDPIWGRMATVYGDPDRPRAINPETALVHARYIGARYAGNNVIWLVAGDTRYDTPESVSYWNSFAEELDRASGGRHLMTAHATGSRGSFYYFNDADWLDFNTYTGAHLISGDYNWRGAVQSQEAVPTRPSMNIEYNFEDLYDQFWLYFSDTTGAVRLTSEDVRRAAYQSVLSGAIAGISYGANGLWQWIKPGHIEGFGVRRTAIDALTFPGSLQISFLKSIMESVDWYRFEDFDQIVFASEADRKVTVAAGEDYVLGYLPVGTSSVTLDETQLSDRYEVSWIDPSSGSQYGEEHGYVEPDSLGLVVRPPDARDWLFKIDKNGSEMPPADLKLKLGVDVYPNPSSGECTIRLFVRTAGQITLEVFDTLGRLLFDRRQEVRAGETRFKYESTGKGVFLYRAKLLSEKEISQETGTFVSI
jgi:hypothetical protein